MRKKSGRKVFIAVLAVVCIVSAVVRFNIEPADYKKSLSNKIVKAEELIDSAKMGNDKGEYSQYNVQDFQNQVKVASNVVEDDASYYDIEKAAYENLKEEIKLFEKNTNSHCLSKSKIQELIDDSKEDTEKITLSDEYELQWNIKGKDIEESSAINLEAKLESPYTSRLDEYIGKLSLNCEKISFYHNGDLPSEISVSVNYKYDSENDKVYLYKFNTEENTLEYNCEAEINDSSVEFKIEEGGDYILLKDKLESYASDEEIKSIENQITKNVEVIDTADKEESIKSKDSTAKSIENTEGDDISTTDNTSNRDGASNSTTTDSENTSNSTNSSTITTPDIKPAQNTPSNTETPQKPGKVTCTIEIRCDTLVGTGKLQKEEKESWVPLDGTILKTTTVTVDEGKNVYDVLLNMCRNNDIQIDAEYTQMYSGYYIKGMNYLYEFDGGDLSGWMYKVNGDFPNYGCSQYTVKNGDVIVWLYTCDMGTDIGEDHSDWK